MSFSSRRRPEWVDFLLIGTKSNEFRDLLAEVALSLPKNGNGMSWGRKCVFHKRLNDCSSEKFTFKKAKVLAKLNKGWLLFDNLEDDPTCWWYRVDYKVGEKTFRIGLACAFENGAHAVSVLTQRLIEHLNPLLVGMTGVPAARKGGKTKQGPIQLGDLLVAGSAYNCVPQKIMSRPYINPTAYPLLGLTIFNVEEKSPASITKCTYDPSDADLTMEKWETKKTYYAHKRTRETDVDIFRIDAKPLDLLGKSLRRLITQFQPCAGTQAFFCWQDIWHEALLKWEEGKNNKSPDFEDLKAARGIRFNASSSAVNSAAPPVIHWLDDEDDGVKLAMVGSVVSTDNLFERHLMFWDSEMNCLDMESYAVGKVCETNKIPFLWMKTVQDFAGAHKSDDLQEFGGRFSARVMMVVVKELCDKVNDAIKNSLPKSENGLDFWEKISTLPASDSIEDGEGASTQDDVAPAIPLFLNRPWWTEKHAYAFIHLYASSKDDGQIWIRSSHSEAKMLVDAVWGERNLPLFIYFDLTLLKQTANPNKIQESAELLPIFLRLGLHSERATILVQNPRNAAGDENWLQHISTHINNCLGVENNNPLLIGSLLGAIYPVGAAIKQPLMHSQHQPPPSGNDCMACEIEKWMDEWMKNNVMANVSPTKDEMMSTLSLDIPYDSDAAPKRQLLRYGPKLKSNIGKALPHVEIRNVNEPLLNWRDSSSPPKAHITARDRINKTKLADMAIDLSVLPTGITALYNHKGHPIQGGSGDSKISMEQRK